MKNNQRDVNEGKRDMKETNCMCNKCDKDFEFDPLRRVYKCSCREIAEKTWLEENDKAIDNLLTIKE